MKVLCPRRDRCFHREVSDGRNFTDGIKVVVIQEPSRVS